MLQEKFEALVLEHSDSKYFSNKVLFYQKVFETIQQEVNRQRRRRNKEKMTESLKLANLALKAKAHAWAQRSEKEFLNHVNDNIAKQRNLSYKDNAYTEIYMKHLLNEKKSLKYI